MDKYCIDCKYFKVIDELKGKCKFYYDPCAQVILAIGTYACAYFERKEGNPEPKDE